MLAICLLLWPTVVPRCPRRCNDLLTRRRVNPDRLARRVRGAAQITGTFTFKPASACSADGSVDMDVVIAATGAAHVPMHVTEPYRVEGTTLRIGAGLLLGEFPV